MFSVARGRVGGVFQLFKVYFLKVHERYAKIKEKEKTAKKFEDEIAIHRLSR